MENLNSNIQLPEWALWLDALGPIIGGFFVLIAAGIAIWGINKQINHKEEVINKNIENQLFAVASGLFAELHENKISMKNFSICPEALFNIINLTNKGKPYPLSTLNILFKSSAESIGKLDPKIAAFVIRSYYHIESFQNYLRVIAPSQFKNKIEFNKNWNGICENIDTTIELIDTTLYLLHQYTHSSVPEDLKELFEQYDSEAENLTHLNTKT